MSGSDDHGVLFDSCSSNIMGIVSDLDDDGVKWLGARLDRKVRVIVAVYEGCPTRSHHLRQLLKFQTEKKGSIEFHILPMEVDSTGTPANCLAAIPQDKSNPVLLFGSRSNFGISAPDPTQFSMAFRADLALANAWRCWFDNTWTKASLLTESTADIPAIVPASGSPDAAAHWRDYCSRCTASQAAQKSPEITIRSVEDPNSTAPNSIPDDSSTQTSSLAKTPSEFVGMPKPDKLTGRVMRLLERGQQVTIAHDKAVKPIEVPVSPRLFYQDTEIRERTVIQRQSFRISAFSEDELKEFERFRTASQTTVKKLSLTMGTGFYWMPDNMISILMSEFDAIEKDAQRFLSGLVKSDAHEFVTEKKDQIEQDLRATHIRIGGQGALRQATLTKVLNDLERRIKKALELPILAPVTFSKVTFNLQEERSQEAPWAQVEKLILALARFPREAIRNPNKVLSDLTTSETKILEAMNIENDKIIELKRENRTEAEHTSLWGLEMLNRIGEFERDGITERNRCKACFMIIDGKSRKKIKNYILRKLS